MSLEAITHKINALKNNLFEAIEALEILKTIDSRIDFIKEKKFDAFIVALQSNMINSVILSLCKIFEENQDSNNIKKLHNNLLCNFRIFPNQDQNKRLYQQVKYTFFNLEPLPEIFTTQELLDVVDSTLQSFSSEFQTDIKALKAMRDTKIAHTDLKDRPYDKTTWGKVDKLILFLKEYVDILNSHLFNICESSDNDTKPCTSLYSDATKAKRCFERILKNLEEEKE
jgi:hypothetical protein